MKKREFGEFLYRFYNKRTSSFLANVYKASVTHDSRDIHRARLDVKKIFVLFGLFEMLDSVSFSKLGGYTLFRPLYRQAGIIREIQVSYLLLENPMSEGAVYNSFITWLKEKERQAIGEFLHLVKKFKENKLKDMDKAVQKICQKSSIFNLRSKTYEYIIDKAERIKDMHLDEPGDKEIHRIRKILKTMATIATLVYSIKSGKKLDLVITELNKTEMMIGEWHDRVVLKEAIAQFFNENRHVPEEETISLTLLTQDLNSFNLKLAEHFIPEVKTIVKTILAGKN